MLRQSSASRQRNLGTSGTTRGLQTMQQLAVLQVLTYSTGPGDTRHQAPNSCAVLPQVRTSYKSHGSTRMQSVLLPDCPALHPCSCQWQFSIVHRCCRRSHVPTSVQHSTVNRRHARATIKKKKAKTLRTCGTGRRKERRMEGETTRPTSKQAIMQVADIHSVPRTRPSNKSRFCCMHCLL